MRIQTMAIIKLAVTKIGDYKVGGLKKLAMIKLAVPKIDDSLIRSLKLVIKN
jgi:hypothetical protein